MSILALVHCKSWGKFWEVNACRAENIPAAPAFSRSTIAGTVASNFLSVAADCSGNVYAVGHQINQTVAYSPTLSISGAADGFEAALIIKYNSAGETLWGKAAITTTAASRFSAVTVDATGNVYAAGYQVNNNPVNYGNGVTAQGSTTGNNPVLVKYNASGVTEWARTISAGTANAQFNGVATDAAGNVYAIGYQFTTQSFGYGSGITVSGVASSENPVIVKYDSTGKALWARSTIGVGAANTLFNAVAVDAESRVYAAGHQFGGTPTNYGTGDVSVGCSGSCSVLVRYDTSGNTIWAYGASGAGLVSSTFAAVTVDASGNIYAAGSQTDVMTYSYNGASVAASLAGQANLVVVRYDSSGTGVWARSLTAAAAASLYAGISADSAGNIYAAGFQNNTGAYTYGPGVTVSAFTAASNAVVVKYDSSGTAQWARTVTNGGGASEFKGVSVDAAGNIYTAGYQSQNLSYTYGNLLSVAGASAATNNAVLLKFAP